MSLPKKLSNAVRNKDINYPFTQDDFKSWITNKQITDKNGNEYKPSTIDSYCTHNDILSSSTTKNKDLVHIPNTNPRKYILKEDFMQITEMLREKASN